MTEVFITDIQTKFQATGISAFLKENNPGLKINYDLNETNNTYPCGHTIMRVEGDKIETYGILTAIQNLGYKCGILEDKVCN